MVIYKITNLINDKIYIGQTRRNIKTRWRQHSNLKSDFNKGSRALKEAIKKYGKENFKIEVVDQADDLVELNKKEYLWIKTMDCISPNGYNLVSGGNVAEVISEETRKRMSEAQANRGPVTIETRLKLSKANKGKKRSEETRKRLSKAKIGALNPNYGKQYTEEERAIRSATMSGENNPRYGKKHSEETRKRISKARKGKYSDRHKKALMEISRANKKKVICITNGICYESIKKAAFDLDVDPSSITKVAKGRLKQTKGYVFKYLEVHDGR